MLLSVLFFGLGEQLWSDFMPVYLQAKTRDVAEGEAVLSWQILAIVGVYACLVNIFEACCYIQGGRITARLGDRGSLRSCSACSASPATFFFFPFLLRSAAVLAVLLIKGWEPLAVPVTFTTVGATVEQSRRGMAFALQSIQKRLPKMLGPLIAGFVLLPSWPRACRRQARRIDGYEMRRYDNQNSQMQHAIERKVGLVVRIEGLEQRARNHALQLGELRCQRHDERKKQIDHADDENEPGADKENAAYWLRLTPATHQAQTAVAMPGD